MPVRFVHPYQSYGVGAVATLHPETESALIAQGLAIASANESRLHASGCSVIPAGKSSVVVQNPQVNPASVVTAKLAQLPPDDTLARIARVEPGLGFFTIHGNAEASQDVTVIWSAE